MLRSWQKHHYLRRGALLFLVLFAATALADAGVCQIHTDQNGNCLLPCLCCHVAGVIHSSPTIHVEHVIPHVQASVTTALVLLASNIFHPPRA